MEAAFIDIGLGKNAYLAIDDLLPPNLEQRVKKPSIDTLITSGDELIVQLVREPLGDKGAKVTTHVGLTGRWLVYLPVAGDVALSKKIEDVAERQRLMQLGNHLCRVTEGLILRTAAKDSTFKALEQDMQTLREKWTNMIQASAAMHAPCQLYCNESFWPGLLRDITSDQIEEIVVANEQLYLETQHKLNQIAPWLCDRVRIHEDEQPILDFYGIKPQWQKALKSKQDLKSGGFIVIEQTEAMTVIDVNTGKFVGTLNLENTVFHTNMEAAQEIAYQIRLRDIGGIIVIDFIDMLREEHRELIKQQLETYMKQDRVKTYIAGWTKLGLLEMTRKKSRDHK